jgi:hypothetical protein
MPFIDLTIVITGEPDSRQVMAGQLLGVCPQPRFYQTEEKPNSNIPLVKNAIGQDGAVL